MSNLSYLDELESNSIYILREAYREIKPLAMLWSMGKDSNVLLWLAKKAFFGRVPFKVLLLDTENEHEEVYRFRDKYVKEWDIDYLNIECPAVEDTDASLPPNARFASRKTLGLKNAILTHGFQGIFVGIRRDEQAIRGKERVFSPRDFDGNWNFKKQPPEIWNQYSFNLPYNAHMRIHPLLEWSELDIWMYIKKEKIPVVPLYFSRNGKRYRSLGETNITFPISSNAATIDEIIEELKITQQSERSGRTMDNEKESSFEDLRSKGYM